MRIQPILLVALVGLVGCEADSAPEIEPAAETAPVTPLPEPATQTPTGVESGEAVLTVAESAEHGAFLTDAAGRAVYLLEQEPAGTATCYDACAETWPPLLANQGSPMPGGPMIRQELIGTIERRDGTTQVTYGGHALYYYAEDQGPGQATGQDVTDQWGEWYLVSPEGEAVEEQAESA